MTEKEVCLNPVRHTFLHMSHILNYFRWGNFLHLAQCMRVFFE